MCVEIIYIIKELINSVKTDMKKFKKPQISLGYSDNSTQREFIILFSVPSVV